MEKEYLKPINTRTRGQQIVDRIKIAIMNKELLPGDQLPPERDLAVAFGVSRNTVREAAKYLSAVGILETRKVSGLPGNFITKGFSDCMMDPIIYGIILSQSDSMNTLKDMRKWIEFSILDMAASNADKDDRKKLIAKLAILKEELRKKDNLDRIIEADEEFYLTAFQSAHNTLFNDIAKAARAFTIESRKKHFDDYLKAGKADKIYKNREVLFNIINKKKVEFLRDLIMQDPFYK